MQPILTLVLTLFLGVSYGQSFIYPSINTNGRKLTDFVPAGWTIRDTAMGDLNKDFIDDVAMILQHNDSVNIIKAGENTVITQPRILLILFKDASNNDLSQREQSNSFILNHDNASMEDPYQEMAIQKGELHIKFHLFYSMGSWYVTTASYAFRYQQGQFVLIGADHYSFHRASMDFEEYSYNFLTKKRSLVKGNENKRNKKTFWKPLNISTLKTFKTFKQPFTWEVEKDFFL